MEQAERGKHVVHTVVAYAVLEDLFCHWANARLLLLGANVSACHTILTRLSLCYMHMTTRGHDLALALVRQILWLVTALLESISFWLFDASSLLQLEALILDGNSLTGPLPNSWGSLKKVSVLCMIRQRPLVVYIYLH